MEDIKQSKYNYNYGIALLKMLMCFEVILSHFWVNQSSVLLTPFKLVENKPVLIFVSFFLFYGEDISHK